MTETTKKLLELLEEHAAKFPSQEPCLQLIPIAGRREVSYSIYPNDLLQLAAEVRELDRILPEETLKVTRPNTIPYDQ